MNFSSKPASEQQLIVKTLSEHVTPERWAQMQTNVENRTRHLTLALEDIYQAHNAAAVIRSCEAFGVQDIHVIEGRNELNLDATTVAKGAEKWLDFHYYNEKGADNTGECISALKTKGYQVVATTLREDSVDLDDISIEKPLAIIVGNELHGLSNEACEQADIALKLQMRGFVQSLNLSVCAALTLHTLSDRLRKSKIDWRLSEEDKREVLFTWLTRCITHWEKII